MKLGHEILYLSNADIAVSGTTLAAVEAAVEAMFAAKAAGSAVMKPKLGLHPPGRVELAAEQGRDPRPEGLGPQRGLGVGGLADLFELGRVEGPAEQRPVGRPASTGFSSM